MVCAKAKAHFPMCIRLYVCIVYGLDGIQRQRQGWRETQKPERFQHDGEIKTNP